MIGFSRKQREKPNGRSSRPEFFERGEKGRGELSGSRYFLGDRLIKKSGAV
jgi:hypothetical protein